jgi:hypothetical protein
VVGTAAPVPAAAVIAAPRSIARRETPVLIASFLLNRLRENSTQGSEISESYCHHVSRRERPVPVGFRATGRADVRLT